MSVTVYLIGSSTPSSVSDSFSTDSVTSFITLQIEKHTKLQYNVLEMRTT